MISTTIRSERTLVPPVTAERSPPASRMTGADSPVIADSSTEAMPSTTVPSPGISSSASTTTRSPLRSVEAGTLSSRRSGPTSRRATASVFVRRSASAWALPRPSAIASAKFAKRTVNQSQRAIWRWKENDPRVPTAEEGERREDARRPRRRTSPGSSPCGAGRACGRSRPRPGVTRARSRSLIVGGLGHRIRLRTSGPRPSEVLDDRAEGEGGEEGQRPDDQDHADEQEREERAVDGKGPGRLRPASSSPRATRRSPGSG